MVPVEAKGGALVTGANRGVGRRLALLLAELGYSVAVNYRTRSEEAEAVAEEARAFGVEAFALQADVTDAAEAARLVSEAERQTGGLQVLVNNVGNYHHGPLAELDDRTFRDMLDSNLLSAFHTCQATAPLMAERGSGRIINIGYAGAEQLRAKPGIIAYQIAKTGVILYSRSLAKVYARHGVTANVVSPGVLENSDTFPPLSEVPAGRFGSLDELAGAVRYLVSDEAAYVTGVTIEVAGGWNL